MEVLRKGPEVGGAFDAYKPGLALEIYFLMPLMHNDNLTAPSVLTAL